MSHDDQAKKRPALDAGEFEKSFDRLRRPQNDEPFALEPAAFRVYPVEFRCFQMFLLLVEVPKASSEKKSG